MRRRFPSRLLAAALTLLAAAPCARSQAAQDCSALGQTTFVRDTLNDIYFWYRDLKPADPARLRSVFERFGFKTWLREFEGSAAPAAGAPRPMPLASTGARRAAPGAPRDALPSVRRTLH